MFLGEIFIQAIQILDSYSILELRIRYDKEFLSLLSLHSATFIKLEVWEAKTLKKMISNYNLNIQKIFNERYELVFFHSGSLRLAGPHITAERELKCPLR